METHVNVAETHHKITSFQQKIGSGKGSESFSEAPRVKRDHLEGKHVSVAIKFLLFLLLLEISIMQKEMTFKPSDLLKKLYP